MPRTIIRSSDLPLGKCCVGNLRERGTPAESVVRRAAGTRQASSPSKWTRSCENRKRCAAIHPMDSNIPRVLETKFAAGSRRCPGVSSGTRARLRAGACF